MSLEEMRALRETGKWDGFSILQVSDLLSLGYTETEVRHLLQAADLLNCHPDWSESTLEEIKEHFSLFYSDLIGESK
jgi:hypothetical protein